MKDLIRDSEKEFLQKAIKFKETLGINSVVLLMGSRAAGYIDDWSDLDLWVVGNKEKLSIEARNIYNKTGNTFDTLFFSHSCKY